MDIGSYAYVREEHNNINNNNTSGVCVCAWLERRARSRAAKHAARYAGKQTLHLLQWAHSCLARCKQASYKGKRG